MVSPGRAWQPQPARAGAVTFRSRPGHGSPVTQLSRASAPLLLVCALAAALAGCSNRVERFDSYPRYGSDYSRLGGPPGANGGAGAKAPR